MIKSWEKRIKLLHQKKYRQEEELFLVEGEKSVVELLQTDFQIVALFATEKFDRKNNHFYRKDFFYEIVKANDLEKTGTLQSNDSALAVVQMPKNQDFILENELVLALDNINDPGNLGTIIRIADWYGIHKILCSLQTVDWYNPKVITASKGSFLRIKPYYSDLAKIFSKTSCQIYGAF
ncbi:MAG: RNA methyltransferase, partial [Bacteroidetes bacterium]